MPKQAVIEYQCERCPRKWYAPPPGSDIKDSSLQLLFQHSDGEVSLSFGILCEKCEGACLTYVNNIRKVRNEVEAETPETEG
jgi:hypothetical protein